MVAVGVVELDVKDDRNAAFERKKAALKFACLRHEGLLPLRVIVGERQILPADMAGEEKPSREDMREHGGRRRLAVAAREGDRPFEPLCDHAEQFCTRQQAFSRPSCRSELRMVPVHGARKDHGVFRNDFFTAERYGDARLSQHREKRPLGSVAPAHTDAVRAQKTGERAHAHAADPDKIDAAREEFGKHTPSYAAAPKNGATHERQRPANGSARPLRSMKKHGGKAVFFRSRISI